MLMLVSVLVLFVTVFMLSMRFLVVDVRVLAQVAQEVRHIVGVDFNQVSQQRVAVDTGWQAVAPAAAPGLDWFSSYRHCLTLALYAAFGLIGPNAPIACLLFR